MSPERQARPGTDAPPRDPSRDPLPGRVLDGRYRVLERIARGGMASVYTALDLRLDRVVAVKIMHPGLGDDGEFAARFVGEARAAARLSHPHVVAVYDQGEDDGVVFLAMELVSGHTLRDAITQRSPMSPLHAVSLLEPVVGALAAAHEAGLVHRDVKPENVLIADDGRVKVADFGLAKAITSMTQHTATGMLIGTVSYVAPEIVTEGRSDARGDVYAVGVILYELLTGAKPHTGETPIQIAYRHVHHDVPPPSAAVPGIAPYVDALVARTTARDPGLRPSDARVLRRQLAQVRLALTAGLDDDPRLTADLRLPTGHEPEDTLTEDLGHRGHDRHDRADEPDDAWEHSAIADLFGPPAATGRARPGHEDTRERVLTAPVSRRTAAAPAPSAARTGPPTRPVRADRPAPPASPPEQPPAGRRPRRSRRGPLLLVLALLVAGAVGAGAWWFGYARYTATPGVLGLTQAAAERQLDRAGLAVGDVDQEYSDTVEAGAVIASEPGPGDRAVDGSTVALTLSRGVEEYDVPATKGLTEDAAQDAIRTAHLDFGTSTEAWSETIPAGQVLRSDPDPGTTVRPGTVVDLVVSLGREPVKTGDWAGRKASTAAAKLTERGLVADTDREEYSDTVPEGRVISQDPAVGTLYRGDTVTLVVSRGPQLVAVPDGLVAAGVDAATQALQEAGFEVQVERSSTYIGLGYVLDVQPGSGTELPKGSVVVLSLV